MVKNACFVLQLQLQLQLNSCSCGWSRRRQNELLCHAVKNSWGQVTNDLLHMLFFQKKLFQKAFFRLRKERKNMRKWTRRKKNDCLAKMEQGGNLKTIEISHLQSAFDSILRKVLEFIHSQHWVPIRKN